MPHGPGNEVGVSTLGGWQLGINIHSQYPDEAFRFIDFLTQADQQSYRLIHAGQPATNKLSYEDEAVLATNPYMDTMFNILVNARPRPVHPQYITISEVMQIEVHAVLTGQKDAETATADMAEQIEAIIAE